MNRIGIGEVAQRYSSASGCKPVVLGSNPAPRQQMANLSLIRLPLGMAQYPVLASEGGRVTKIQ
jgi:hypothetical protein